ncbi:MAG: polysaccharide biosynthesis/export family protein [Fimbriimonadaceae bacterium]|nr:polysaccharide biosynthesis/export family protein [Fimbriimonadaceae bacterium]QYK59269.1 MAG: polysaccharide biosynthesis/export family protein [Fimbriimonadaceae bacterium]
MKATGKIMGVLRLRAVVFMVLFVAQVALAQTAFESKLKPGDKLLLTIGEEKAATFDLEIQPDGRIHLPRAGTVQVEGKTVTEAEELVVRAYRAVYRDPIVSLALKEAKRNVVLVTSIRGNLSEVEWRADLDLRTALVPGITTSDLDLYAVRVFRDQAMVAEVDLALLFAKDSTEWNGPLLPQDVVSIVPTPYVRVWITGNIGRPGQVKIEAGRTVQEAVGLAGGIVRMVSEQQLEESDFEIVVRRGAQEFVLPALQSAGDSPFIVLDGDSVSVQLSLVPVVVGGEVARPGRYYVSKDSGLPEAVAKAGGIRPTGTLKGALLVRSGAVRAFDIGPFGSGPLDSDLDAKPGDVVYVAVNQRAFTVLGRALRPGRYPMSDETAYRASDALAAAGGSHPQVSTDRRMVIVRFGEDGLPRLIKFNLDEFYKDGKAEANPLVLPGDTLVVAPKQEFSVSSVASILAGLFSLDRILRR